MWNDDSNKQTVITSSWIRWYLEVRGFHGDCQDDKQPSLQAQPQHVGLTKTFLNYIYNCPTLIVTITYPSNRVLEWHLNQLQQAKRGFTAIVMTSTCIFLSSSWRRFDYFVQNNSKYFENSRFWYFAVLKVVWYILCTVMYRLYRLRAQANFWVLPLPAAISD